MTDYTDSQVTDLIVNKLSLAKYQELKSAGTLQADQLYQITDPESAGGNTSWGSITGTLSNQTDLQNALNTKVNIADLATVATSGSYSDLTNKPSEVTESIVSGWGFTKNVGTVTSVNNTQPVNGNVSLSIPTVNDATLTITQGGTTKGTFTANASSNVTIDLDAGGSSGHNLFDVVEKDHELTDDESAGYAKLGTYVYKNAFGDALGYPDFVDQAITEYNESLTNVKYGYKSSNVNLEGAVTEVDGFIQGFFGKVSYATFPAKTPTTSFELVVKHRIQALTTTSSILEENAQYKGITLRNINATTGQTNIWVGTGSAQTVSNVNTNCPTTVGVWNWHKITWDGTNLTVAVSLDGVNYTVGLTQALALAPDWDSTSLQDFGGGSWEDDSDINGEVDLNECYLDIDGERYWTGVNKYKYYESTSGKLFYDIADKADIDLIYENTHSAWLYGIDEVNNRVFLPRNIERKLVKSQEPTGALKAWYNLYSDGWCEQGALVSAIDANWRDRKISFVIPFNNIGYDLHIQTAHTTNTDASPINEKTETYFGCKAYNSTGNATWSAAGYTDFTTPDYRYMVVGSNAPQSQTIEALDITSSENDTVPLGYCVYQNSEAQSNPAWLKSNGMWYQKALYPTFYSYLLANIGHNNIVDSTTTITDDTDKFIIDQTTETFKLPIRTGERRLVYTYKNDTDWVNWYSDGWCEQGGISPSAGDTSSNTIVLLKSYKDISYSILFAQNAGVEGSYTNGCTAKDKTTSSFILTYRTGGDASFYWKACGYTAIPQLSDYNVSESLYVKVSNAVQNLQLVDISVLLNYMKTFEVVDDLPETQLNNVFYFCKNYQE